MLAKCCKKGLTVEDLYYILEVILAIYSLLRRNGCVQRAIAMYWRQLVGSLSRQISKQVIDEIS